MQYSASFDVMGHGICPFIISIFERKNGTKSALKCSKLGSRMHFFSGGFTPWTPTRGRLPWTTAPPGPPGPTNARGKPPLRRFSCAAPVCGSSIRMPSWILVMDLLEPTIVNRAYSCSCFSVHALHNSSSTITFGFHCFTFFSFLRAQLKPRQLVNQLKGTDSLCDFWRWVRFYDNSIIFNRLNRLKQVWRPYVYFGFASLRLKRSIKSKERIHFAILFILRLYHISRVLY